MNNGFFYNGRGSSELTDRILGLIAGASRYIKTGNFLFQDRRVIEALEDAMHRGVAVFILSNIDGGKSSDKDDDGHVDTHLPNLKELSSRGAHCRGLDDLHAKFILTDGQYGILMSANFSPNSIEGNIETGVLLMDDEVDDLEYVFDKLYMNADVQGVSKTAGRTLILRSSEMLQSDTFSREHLSSHLRYTIVGKRKNGVQTNLSLCDVRSIYESILAVIKGAKEKLDVVTWHFKAVEMLPEFMKELTAALLRGVKVRLYSNDRLENDSLKESLRCLDLLKGLGCEVYGDEVNHSKCVISENAGVIFTANIDGVHGLKSGFEVGCELQGDRLERMRSFVESLFV